MTHDLTSLDALAQHRFDTIIDVRAPAEFAEDHMPGAISLPVLSDAERAHVGTIYKQQSPFLARKVGAALVARNAASHIEGPLADKDGGWQPLVYCWRGGQRSNSFASILSQIGWRVEVVAGGYRSYRGLVKSALYDAPFPARVVLLDGFTGTAKTELLHLARARGVQVLDLEGLAHHRGSVFGGRDAPQPSQKAFESALAMQIAALDPARPVLVEAESSRVGSCTVPPSLWAAMRAAARIEVVAPPGARADYLLRVYGDITADAQRLDAILAGLTRLQGHERVEAWRRMAREGALRPLAEDLITLHYDPRYAKQRGRDGDEYLGQLRAERLDEAELGRIADRIAGMVAQA